MEKPYRRNVKKHLLIYRPNPFLSCLQNVNHRVLEHAESCDSLGARGCQESAYRKYTEWRKQAQAPKLEMNVIVKKDSLHLSLLSSLLLLVVCV